MGAVYRLNLFVSSNADGALTDVACTGLVPMGRATIKSKILSYRSGSSEVETTETKIAFVGHLTGHNGSPKIK